MRWEANTQFPHITQDRYYGIELEGQDLGDSYYIRIDKDRKHIQSDGNPPVPTGNIHSWILLEELEDAIPLLRKFCSYFKSVCPIQGYGQGWLELTFDEHELNDLHGVILTRHQHMQGKIGKLVLGGFVKVDANGFLCAWNHGPYVSKLK